MFQAVLGGIRLWSNVEKTCASIGDKLNLEYIERLTTEKLEQFIRLCSFCIDCHDVQKTPVLDLRNELLSIRGIGAETEDIPCCSRYILACDVWMEQIPRFPDRRPPKKM